MWLAKVAERGMCRPSLVHPKPIRQLRDLTRYRRALTQDRTREMQRAEKLLEDAQVKLSSVISDIFGVSGRAMLEALVAGQRDPAVLSQLARGSMRKKIPDVQEALRGFFTDHHARILAMMLGNIDRLTAQITTLDATIEEVIAPFAAQVAQLDEVTGIGLVAAQDLIAEPGRTAALLRRSPLRTVHAPRRRTRLKQAARASRVEVLASRAGGRVSAGGRWRVSSGFV